MTEHIPRTATVGGIRFVRHGDTLWSEGDGTLWTCPKCADYRAVTDLQGHARWHGAVHPWRTREQMAPTLGDREAIDDEQ